MEKASLPVNEQERLVALKEYDILDTMPESEFDDITRMASAICHTPVSLINIIDENRQWIKSNYGLAGRETKREYSFCTYAIANPDDILIIPDLREDDRFYDHPFVAGKPNMVFYAGVPLVNPNGYALGALCIMDYEPRSLDATQIVNLRALARQVVALLELRKNARQLKEVRAELSYLYTDFEKLCTIASHDLKSPLNNIISLTHLLLQDYATKLDAEGNEYIAFLNDAAYHLSDLVSGILSYAKSSQLIVRDKEDIRVSSLVEEVASLLNVPENMFISFTKDNRQAYTSRIALKQILTQLIHNAVKYNDKSQGTVEVKFHEDQTRYLFEVKDNGPGIAASDTEKIFALFDRLNNKIRDGESMGIGLTIVKRLAEKLDGEISLISEPGKGSTFILSIPK